MKSKDNINKSIEDTFEVLDTIEEVKVNHFFKHKVLQQLENQKVENTKVFDWFTPQLQLATLGLILLMNASALFYSYSNQAEPSSANLQTFAKEYKLQSETTSLIN